jgi:redox-sensitive bicupin YhaK (pirin superfamily)
MLRLRPGDSRGRTSLGWLDSRHSFSFGHYRDRAHMGFRSLRVINEDRVVAAAGFPPHSHRDMEIISYVLAGVLEHKDSLGNGTVIRPGEVQRMSAGTGITHSECNPSKEAPVHFLQIWILPDREGIAPGYEQRPYPAAERQGRLRLVASPDGREGSIIVHQDAALYVSLLEAEQAVEHRIASGRHAWLQVARGSVEANGERLGGGDGAAISAEPRLAVRAEEPSEILLFDLG